MLRDCDKRVPARRPSPAGNQIDRTDSRIEKYLRTLAEPGVIDRRVILRLTFPLSWQDDPGHLRGHSGDVGSVNAARRERHAHVILHHQFEVARDRQSSKTEHFAMLRVVVAGQRADQVKIELVDG